MAETPYFGQYFRFETEDKRKAADLLSTNNLVGDRYRVEFMEEDEGTKAWLVNRFDDRIGFLDGAGAYEARLAIARGWTTVAFLSFVAYTQNPEPGFYWGEVALIAYDSRYEDEMSVFLEALADSMGNGVRPKIDFGKDAFNQIIETKGSWFPKNRVKMPEMEKGTAVVKDHRTANDHLIEQARKGNVGCYIGSWVFLLAAVAAILFGLHSCGVF